MSTSGPQEGLGFFGAGSTGGQAVDLAPVNARIDREESRITALEKVIDGAVTSVALDGNTMTFGHADGAKHSVVIPGGSSSTPAINQLKADIATLEAKLKAQGVDVTALKANGQTYQHELSELSGAYAYTGPTPSYPTDKKHTYVVNFNNISGKQVGSVLPDADEGTMLYFTNLDADTRVVLRPPTGQSVSLGDHYDLDPGQFVAFVKSGSGFTKVSGGPYHVDKADLVNQVAQQLANQLHTKDEIQQFFNEWLANPTTQQKIKQIVKSTEPHDQTQIYYGTADDYPADFTGAQGPYQAHQDFIVNGLDKVASKVWIAVPWSVADTVVGIVTDEGLPAQWDSKRVSIDGKYWQIYLSPYEMHAATMKLDIKWRIK